MISENRHNQWVEMQSGPLDVRQAEVIKTGEFWRLYKEEVFDLFVALGKEDEWSDRPDDWLPAVRSNWIGNEQGYSDDKEMFTDSQIEAALLVLDRMGLSQEVIPPPGHYDALLILGATMGALEERISWISNRRITADQVVVLAGQRPIDERRDGTIQELLSNEGEPGEFGGNDVSDDPWATTIIDNESRKRLLYETDMARLAVVKKLGKTALRRVTLVPPIDVTHLSDDEIYDKLPRRVGDIPQRIATDYYFTVHMSVDGEECKQDVIILNGRAVPRERGNPRPTTASTAIEWLERLAPSFRSTKEIYKVVIVSGNPHTVRTIEEFQRVLDKAGRSDIMLVAAGTLPADTAPICRLQTALGEVGRMIDRDPTAHTTEVHNGTNNTKDNGH